MREKKDNYESVSIPGGIKSLAVVWSLLVALSFVWYIYTQNKLKFEYALGEARDSFTRELLLIDWLAGKRTVRPGEGPLAPPDSGALRSPEKGFSGSAFLQGRHAVTCMGMPNFYLRITSLKPLKENNLPDEWEKTALEKLAAGKNEVFSIDVSDGRKYLRYMGPVAQLDECCSCHNNQMGNQNGISITLPLEPAAQMVKGHFLEAGLSYIAFWLIGLAGLFWAFSRITRQQRLNSIVQRELTRIRSAVECASEAILITDENGHAVYTNPAFILLFNQTLEELKNAGIDVIFAEPDVTQHITEILNGKADFWEGESVVLAAGGRKITAWCRFSRIYDESGEYDGMRLMLTDMTEAKKSQEESLQRERLSAALALAGAACHEINQPLQAALGYSELAIMSGKACTCGKTNVQSLMTIREQVLRVAGIVKKLHGISRYRTANYVGQSHIVDLEKSSTPDTPSE